MREPIKASQEQEKRMVVSTLSHPWKAKTRARWHPDIAPVESTPGLGGEKVIWAVVCFERGSQVPVGWKTVVSSACQYHPRTRAGSTATKGPSNGVRWPKTTVGASSEETRSDARVEIEEGELKILDVIGWIHISMFFYRSLRARDKPSSSTCITPC